jgi:hypothetical protein
MLDVPNYPEFTVKRLYEMFAGDAHVMMYLPDPASQSRPAIRTWVYTVVCSLRSEYMSAVFSQARQRRVKNVPMRENYVRTEIAPKFQAVLLAEPYISGKFTFSPLNFHIDKAFAYLSVTDRARKRRPRRPAPAWAEAAADFTMRLERDQEIYR